MRAFFLASRLRPIGLWVIFGAVVIVAGCAHQPIPEAYDPPGFFMGVWHGATMGFSLIGEIFFNHRIYAFPNSGGWYDLGYVLGGGGLIGGLFKSLL